LTVLYVPSSKRYRGSKEGVGGGRVHFGVHPQIGRELPVEVEQEQARKRRPELFGGCGAVEE